MDSLPSEVLDMIIGHIHGLLTPSRYGQTRIARYATVSRSWQKAIESRTMQSISLNDQQIGVFSKIFSPKQGSNRCQILRIVHLTTECPTVSRTPEDHEGNNRTFKDVLVRFFEILASWTRDIRREKGLRLNLSWRAYDRGRGSQRYPPTNTFLNGQLDLPVVHCITELSTSKSKGILPHPHAVFHLISRLPSLESLDLRLSLPSPEAANLNVEHRRALADGLSRIRQENPELSSLRLSFGNVKTFWNHSFECPDFTEDGVDQLSTAIRQLGEAGRLITLELKDVSITSDLFGTTPWPSIRNLAIHSRLMLANGQWLYTGNPNGILERDAPEESEVDEETEDSESDSNDHPFEPRHSDPTPVPEHEDGRPWRIIPDPAVYEPLLEHMIRTITRSMPSLQRFYFHTETLTVIDCLIIVQAATAGSPWFSNQDRGGRPEDQEDESLKRFKIWIHTDPCKTGVQPDRWEVSESVMHMAREWTGPNGVVKVQSQYIQRQ